MIQEPSQKPKEKGFFWHVHHNRLVEWCWSYNERADFIKHFKPLSERGLRLRLFQPVRGQLPEEVIQAGEAFAEAQRALTGALEYSLWNPQRLQDTYTKRLFAFRETLRIHAEAINKLHAEECPDCPWDGETIFPDGNEFGW